MILQDKSKNYMRAKSFMLHKLGLACFGAALPLPHQFQKTEPRTNIGPPNGILAANDAAPASRPGSPWSMPAGAKAPSDASPVLRAWLEHEGPAPEI
jgi:hypothetical protein